MNGTRGAGSLDPEFGDNGQVQLRIQGPGGSSLLLPDGKFLSVGIADRKTVAMARRLPDGALDPSFGLGGVTQTPLGIAVGDFARSSVSVQDDGRVLIAGQVDLTDGGTEASYLCYVRLSPNGQLDGSFGAGGRAVINLPNTPQDEANPAIIQRDGKIVALANSVWGFDMIDTVLLRMNSDGTLDRSFGSHGFTYEFPSSARLWGMEPLSDGKLLITGTRHGDGMISRYEADGSIDRSFGTDGHFYLDVLDQSDFDQITHAAVQSDGKILVVGSTGSSPQTAFIARLNVNASGFDGDFNGGKPLLLKSGGTGNYERYVVALEDGKILSMGSTFGTSSICTLRRFQADGTPDTSFGINGLVEIGGEEGVFHMMSRLEVQPDGKYIVSGSTLDVSSGWYMSIYRVLPD